jgi:hypothetical protein
MHSTYATHLPLLTVVILYCGLFTPYKNCWTTESSKHTRNGRITDWINALLGDSSMDVWIAQQSVMVTWFLYFRSDVTHTHNVWHQQQWDLHAFATLPMGIKHPYGLDRRRLGGPYGRSEHWLTHGAVPLLRSRQLCGYPKNFPAFYGAWKFITVFTRSLQKSYREPDRSSSYHPILSP